MAIGDEEKLALLEDQARWMGDLFRLSLRVFEGDMSVLSVIVREASHMVGVPMAKIDVDQRGEVFWKASFGLTAELANVGHLPVDETFSGQVISTGKPLRVGNVKKEEAFNHRKIVTEYGIMSYLGVPVRRQDNTVVGALAVMSQAPAQFKSIDLELLTILAERVGSELERESYDHELRELKEKFRRLSIMDDLTGTYNRHYMVERLDKELKRAKRYDSKFSFLMLDVDHFKVINDAHGHVFGDLVLKEVALVLGNCVRDVDLVARYGGEEFAMILPETAGESGMIAAERICAMARNHVFADDRNPTRLTISVGIASFPPETSGDCQQLIDKADEALCDAKRDGGDCVRRAT